MNNDDKPIDSADAHPVKKGRASKIAGVRTKPRELVNDSDVEARVPLSLKLAVVAKIKRDKTTLSEVFRAALQDYVDGNLVGRNRDLAGRRNRGASGALFRRRQLAVIALLIDLRNLASEDPKSALWSPAMHGLLVEAVNLSQANFDLLVRHVS